jgi:neutral trehalase
MASQTFRNASGVLPFPYLVPAGPYNEAWDWDSMFMGVALQSFGASAYFMGTFLNFLHFTNLSNGELPGCLTPAGPSQTLYHAKPLIIQASYIAAKQTGNFSAFLAYGDQMRALLCYWNTSSRLDAATGLHKWHDQLETGADNLVLSECPSQYSPECWSESQAYTLASPDLMVWVSREYQAYALFLKAWGALGGSRGGLYSGSSSEEASAALAYTARLKDVIHEYLWLWLDPPRNTRGMYVGFNVSTGQQSVHKTYQVAWPVWAGLAANQSVKSAALTQLMEADLWTAFGIRSVSSEDARYNNDNIINPYSNWRGPVWINVNSIMAYTLRAEGQGAAASALADTIVHTLAQDLRQSSTWHECYDSVNGSGLAAPGFLSWDTLGADLQGNVASGQDPFIIN